MPSDLSKDDKAVLDALYTEHGHKFGGLLAAARAGFNKAYEESKASGFDPDLVISSGSDVRVGAVFDVLQAQYGDIDLNRLGPVAIVGSLALIENVQEALKALESLASSTPEQLENIRQRFVAEYGAAI